MYEWLTTFVLDPFILTGKLAYTNGIYIYLTFRINLTPGENVRNILDFQQLILGHELAIRLRNVRMVIKY